MKRVLVLLVLMLITPMAGNLFSAPDAETLRAALPEGYSLVSVDPESVPLAGKVRTPDGNVITAYLIKSPTGEWVASSNPDYFRALNDVFVQSEQEDETGARVIQAREQVREAAEDRDQDIADDVVDDLR